MEPREGERGRGKVAPAVGARISFGMMRRTLLALLLLAVVSGVSTDGERRHTRLLRSLPAKDSVVTALPSTLQLWFSEPIEVGVSRVRLEGADAKVIPLAPLSQERAKVDAPVTAPFPQSLSDGTYTVHWTTASKDGHVVRGSFVFTLKAR